jgi:hypothetical protein
MRPIWFYVGMWNDGGVCITNRNTDEISCTTPLRKTDMNWHETRSSSENINKCVEEVYADVRGYPSGLRLVALP